MRKSLEHIKHMIINRPYTGTLPEELVPYHVYFSDSGHSIVCVLETHLKAALVTNMDYYEVAVPVKYVLEKGYRKVGDYIVTDAEYDKNLGLIVDEKYYEY